MPYNCNHEETQTWQPVHLFSLVWASLNKEHSTLRIMSCDCAFNKVQTAAWGVLKIHVDVCTTTLIKFLFLICHSLCVWGGWWSVELQHQNNTILTIFLYHQCTSATEIFSYFYSLSVYTVCAWTFTWIKIKV